MNLKDARVLVTATSYGKNDPRLKSELEAQVAEVIYNPTGKPLTAAELIPLLHGIHGYIAGLDVIDRSVIESTDQLKVIARYGVGVDNVDLQAAKDKNILVTNTPGSNSSSVAELALGLILSLARQIPEAVEAVHAGKWPRYPGLSIEGKTVGIIGLGAIGKHLAKRLAGFDCKILAYDPFPDSAFVAKYAIELADMDRVVRESDFLSLHMPLLPETREMVNADFLAKMKKGSCLVNTSRGEVVNEADLFAALQSGHIRGAALDAFTKEPPDPESPLLKLPQVIATPHLGAQTDLATSKMGWMAMEDCLAALQELPTKYPVTGK